MAENKNGLTLSISEDWMAVCLGFVVIAAVLVGVRPPLPKYGWATEGEFAATVAENKLAVEKLIQEAEAKGEANLAASAAALAKAMEGSDRNSIGDASKKLAAEAKTAKDKGLQKKAADIDKAVGAKAGAVAGAVFGAENRGQDRRRVSDRRRRRSHAHGRKRRQISDRLSSRLRSRLALPRDCRQRDGELLGFGVRYFRSPHRPVRRQLHRRSQVANGSRSNRILHQDGACDPRGRHSFL